ncbi:unnamed protein product [Toxocara canis]|uniref:Uncharacterized protein n=1 Tax=Toxocara canis TaxID=6265 RepID=A0A183VHJ8_TOXCA|nr:unnamed protein product [Toxocara canis]
MQLSTLTRAALNDETNTRLVKGTSQTIAECSPNILHTRLAGNVRNNAAFSQIQSDLLKPARSLAPDLPSQT